MSTFLFLLCAACGVIDIFTGHWTLAAIAFVGMFAEAFAGILEAIDEAIDRD